MSRDDQRMSSGAPKSEALNQRRSFPCSLGFIIVNPPQLLRDAQVTSGSHLPHLLFIPARTELVSTGAKKKKSYDVVTVATAEGRVPLWVPSHQPGLFTSTRQCQLNQKSIRPLGGRFKLWVCVCESGLSLKRAPFMPIRVR